jgi:hypothetical protein
MKQIISHIIFTAAMIKYVSGRLLSSGGII